MDGPGRLKRREPWKDLRRGTRTHARVWVGNLTGASVLPTRRGEEQGQPWTNLESLEGSQGHADSPRKRRSCRQAPRKRSLDGVEAVV